jgi:lysozyme family protein
MADHSLAHKEVMKVEGGYANDPIDNGGETWRGIARKFHPSWLGWRIIDKVKKANPGFTTALLNRLLGADKELERLELAFYKVEFWDMIKGDQINDQATATMIYDNAVNVGITPAIRMAQQVAFGIENETQAKALGVAYGRMDAITLNKLNNVA